MNDNGIRSSRRGLRMWPGKAAGSEQAKRTYWVEPLSHAHRVEPLSHAHRVGGYLEQTGRSTMTPRQRRRAQHKQNHYAAAARRSLRNIQEALR